jgi:hypothetical protein
VLPGIKHPLSKDVRTTSKIELTNPEICHRICAHHGLCRYQVKPHPLPWLVEILNGVEHANFFEQRSTEYLKGASRGTWDRKDGVWAEFDRRRHAAAA